MMDAVALEHKSIAIEGVGLFDVKDSLDKRKRCNGIRKRESYA